MTHKEDLAKVCLVEIPDSLKQTNREKRDGREMQTGYRIVISFSGGNDLSEAETTLLAKVSDETKRNKMKEAILKNRTQIRYSGVFTADDLELPLPNGNGVFKTPTDGLSDEQQTHLEKLLREYYAAMDNLGVFTLVTESVSELLKGTEYEGTDYLDYENADGATIKLTEQNRIFFGIFTDYDAAINMLRRNLLRRIEDGDLNVPNETKADTEHKTAADNLGL